MSSLGLAVVPTGRALGHVPVTVQLEAAVARIEAVVAALQLKVAAQDAEISALRGRMDLRSGPRDEEDRRLLRVIAESTQGQTFAAKNLYDHARRVDAALHEALTAATIGNTAELGCWLKRHVGVHAGVAVTRKRRVWRVHVVHDHVRECPDVTLETL